MNWTKFSVATLIGGVAYFLLGWVVFGIILRDLTALPDDVAAVVQIPEEEFKISFMIISCLILGAFYSLILMKWANVSTFTGGLKVTALIGGLYTLVVGFSMASMFRMNSVDQIFINAIGDAVCSGLTGGIIGWYLGRGQ